MSDHLPIVMNLETNEEIVILNTPSLVIDNSIYLENTSVSEKLKIVYPNATPIQFWIINSMGQILSEFNSEGGENLEWDVSYLPTGFYYLKFNTQNNSPIKFIKQ